jgi:hypothetical protein
MRRFLVLIICALGLAATETRAGIELDFWHSYLNAQTHLKHFSFHLASYKRGLFFGSCGPSTRSQQWFFTIDLLGEDPVYDAAHVSVSNDDGASVSVRSGTVRVDQEKKWATIELTVGSTDGPKPFVGNGRFRIVALK